MSRTLLTEAQAAGMRATPVEGRPGRFLLQLIDPGWGASGHYSPEVLESAAAAQVFPAGLHMYLDHPHADGSGVDEHGTRSVRDLVAVLAEDARWTGEALVAEATVFGANRQMLADMAESIGLSIRAYAEAEYGEAEGRRGTIVKQLVEAKSVDFVTRAGRGGKILQVLESAISVEESRNIGQWIESRIHRDFTITADDMAGDGRLTREERIGLSSAIGDALAAFVASLEANHPQLYQRDLWDDPADTVATAIESHRRMRVVVGEATANDTREALQTALRDAYAGEKSWVWVRDFDDSTVWYEHETPDDTGTYAEGYTLADDSAVTLSGSRTEVRVRTTYVPATRPDGNKETEESEEDTMPEIAESELARLREDAGRVQTLESERDAERQRAEAAEAERDQAREQLAESQRASTIARIVAEAADAAHVELNEFETAGLTGRAVRNDDGTINESETRTAFDTAVASIKESRGSVIHGFGRTTPPAPGVVSESDLDTLGDAAFGPISQEA